MKRWHVALITLLVAPIVALPAAGGQEQAMGSSSFGPASSRPAVMPARPPMIDVRAQSAAETVAALPATVRSAADTHRPPFTGPPAAPGPPGQCGGRFATLTGTDGNDDLWGTPGRDVIDARGGDDWIRGLAGNDVICAGDGNDFVFGGDGADLVYGEGGNDLIEGRAGDDQIDGGAGLSDGATFWSSPGGVVGSLADGTATGPHGTDTFTNVEELHGSDHADTFYGSSGDDGLFGLGGNDLLVGAGG